MKPQIVHDTEVHRQHVRLKVPIRVELDGARYRVEDWSVGGFGVENVATSRQPGERFRVRVVFPFPDFELSARVDAQMVYVDRDHQRFGCRFLMLTAEQLDLFHYVVDAYLSGEMVTADDLLQVHARGGGGGGGGGAAASTRSGPPFPGDAAPAEDHEPRARRVRRYVAHAALALAGLLLVGLIAVGVNDRYLTLEASSAVVDAPLYRLRAPIAGLFTSAVEPGEVVSKGEALAVVRGSDGTVAPLESPCACVVLDQPGLLGQFYQPGETLITLAEADRPPWVRAQVPLADVERLEVGDRATIRFPGRDGVLHGEVARISVKPPLASLGGVESQAPIDRHLAQVLIRPDRPLDPHDIGTLVSVRFR